MTRLNLVVDDKSGSLTVDPITGRVATTLHGADRVYAAGACASVAWDRTRETIPGILRLVPNIQFVDLVAAVRDGIKSGV